MRRKEIFVFGCVKKRNRYYLLSDNGLDFFINTDKKVYINTETTDQKKQVSKKILSVLEAYRK